MLPDTLPFIKPQRCLVCDVYRRTTATTQRDLQAGTQLSSLFFCHPLTWSLAAPLDQAVTGFVKEKGCALWTPGLLASASCGESVGPVCFSSIAVFVTAAAELRAVYPLSGLFSLQTLCRQQSVIRVKGWSIVETLYSAGELWRWRGFWRLFANFLVTWRKVIKGWASYSILNNRSLCFRRLTIKVVRNGVTD